MYLVIMYSQTLWCFYFNRINWTILLRSFQSRLMCCFMAGNDIPLGQSWGTTQSTRLAQQLLILLLHLGCFAHTACLAHTCYIQQENCPEPVRASDSIRKVRTKTKLTCLESRRAAICFPAHSETMKSLLPRTMMMLDNDHMEIMKHPQHIHRL